MTTEQFQTYLKTGKFQSHPINVYVDPEDCEFKPNQAFSVQELMKRQAQGLPMPNLTPTIHVDYNGYDLENLPVTARRDVDIIDVQKQLESTKKDIMETERAYSVIKKQSKLRKEQENGTSQNS